MNQIPPLFALVLPGLVAPLAGWIVQQKMPEWLRAAIVLLVIFVVSALWAIYVHSFSANVYDDFVLLAAYCAALIAGPLQPLYKLAEVHLPSPLGLFQPKATKIVDLSKPLPPTPASTQPMEPIPAQPGQQG